MSEKQDLTQHSENELSLVVFNDEYLYNMRRFERRLFSHLEETYTYTKRQLAVLKQDLKEDAIEV